MRAFGAAFGQHQFGVDMDRDAPALGLAKAEDRGACHQRVLDDPEQRSASTRARPGDFLMPFGQVACGEEHRPFGPALAQTFGEMVEAGRAERDLG